MHRAIIDGPLWEKVRLQLAKNASGTQRGASERTSSSLAGLVFDRDGEPLVATHACKGRVRYRYYVSRSLQHGAEPGPNTIRMPAPALEKAVAEELAKQLDRPPHLIAAAGMEMRPQHTSECISACSRTAAKLRTGSRPLLRKLICRVEVGREHVTVEVDTSSLAAHLGTRLQSGVSPLTRLEVDAQLRRSGKVVRLVHRDGRAIGSPEPQENLVKLMRLAHTWWREMQQDGLSATEMARRHGVDKTYVSRVVRLSFLAPKVIQRVLAGEQPPALNARRLLGLRSIPLSWDEQEKLLLSH